MVVAEVECGRAEEPVIGFFFFFFFGFLIMEYKNITCENRATNSQQDTVSLLAFFFFPLVIMEW